jgi:cytidylate kinase
MEGGVIMFLPKYIVVAAEEGSGGCEIAQELAKALGYSYLDGYILEDLQTETVLAKPAPLSQPNSNAGWRISRFNNKPQAEGNLQVLAPVQPSLIKEPVTERNFAKLLEKRLIIRDKVLIFDTRAAFLLADNQNVLKIRIVAPLQERIERLALLLDLDIETAANRVSKADKQEQCLMHRDYSLDWDNPANFNLILNTSGLSLLTATVYLVNFVEAHRQLDKYSSQGIYRSYDRMPARETYNLKEVAEMFQVSWENLCKAIYRGELKARVKRQCSDEILVNKKDLLDWQNQVRLGVERG